LAGFEFENELDGIIGNAKKRRFERGLMLGVTFGLTHHPAPRWITVCDPIPLSHAPDSPTAE